LYVEEQALGESGSECYNSAIEEYRTKNSGRRSQNTEYFYIPKLYFLTNVITWLSIYDWGED
jgi:hypothetical protein